MKKYFAVLLFLVATSAFAQVEVFPPNWEPFLGTDPITGSSLVGQGYARHSVTTVISLATTPAAGVAIHRLARHAILHVEVGTIRVRYDGTDPTTTEGELITTGEKIKFENQRSLLLALEMVSVSGTATVTVTYGR
jgi:hypothetical protein